MQLLGSVKRRGSAHKFGTSFNFNGKQTGASVLAVLSTRYSVGYENTQLENSTFQEKQLKQAEENTICSMTAYS